MGVWTPVVPLQTIAAFWEPMDSQLSCDRDRLVDRDPALFVDRHGTEMT